MVISIPEFFKMMMIQFLPSPEMAEEAPPPTSKKTMESLLSSKISFSSCLACLSNNALKNIPLQAFQKLSSLLQLQTSLFSSKAPKTSKKSPSTLCRSSSPKLSRILPLPKKKPNKSSSSKDLCNPLL